MNFTGSTLPVAVGDVRAHLSLSLSLSFIDTDGNGQSSVGASSNSDDRRNNDLLSMTLADEKNPRHGRKKKRFLEENDSIVSGVKTWNVHYSFRYFCLRCICSNCHYAMLPSKPLLFDIGGSSVVLISPR